MTNKPDSLPEGRGGASVVRLEELAKGLSKAQRELIVRIDDRVWSRSEAHHKTLAALFDRGVTADIRAAGHRFFNLTDLGLALRQSLLNQEKPK